MCIKVVLITVLRESKRSFTIKIKLKFLSIRNDDCYLRFSYPVSLSISFK